MHYPENLTRAWGSRRLWYLVLCSALCVPRRGHAAPIGAAPPPSDPGHGLLFHASFDKSRRADLSVGRDVPCMARYARQNRTAEGGTHVPGVFGKALSGRGGRGGSGEYDALANFLPERGTVALHVRQTGMHYGFEVLRLRTVDPYYWFMYLRLSNKNNSLSAWFPNEVYRPVVLSAGSKCKLGEGEWHHVTVVWDQAYGMRYYFDGEEVASNWEQASWHSRGVDPDQLVLWHSDDVAYDELYVFDRPLSAEQVRRLAKENLPPPAEDRQPILFDEARRQNRLRELSWERPDPGMLKIRVGATGLGANAVKQVEPIQARAVKKGCNQAFDGKLGNGWPPLYNYQYAKGNGLHVELDEPYDFVAVEGYFRGAVYGARHLLPPETQPLAHIKSASFMHRWQLDRPRKGWLSFFKEEMEDKGELPDFELVTRSRVCELGFFRRGAHDLQGTEAKPYYIGRAQIGTDPELTGRFGPGDRAVLDLSEDRPTQDGGQAVPGLRYHHLMVPAESAERALCGIRLSFMLRGTVAGNALRVEMRDPMLPGRRLLAIDFALTGGGAGQQRLDLTIDTADRVLPAARPLWLTFCFKQDVTIVFGKNSFVELRLDTIDQVLPEYLRNEMSFTQTRFSWLSEARPWGAHKEPEKEMIEFSRYARELLRYCREVMYWWIDNRQTPNGELGDAWGDDTDLMQNLPKLALLGDPGGKLACAAKLVADGVYSAGLIERGINRRVMDTLHAYEEGVNAQPVMGLIDYGNPRYVERMMEAVKTVDEFLTAKDVEGRRRFRSGYFGAEGIRDKGKYGFDHPGNALFMHPAMFVSYYSRHPRAVRLLKEWIDGWLDFYAKHGDDKKRHWPKRTLMDGTILGWDYKIRGYGYVDCYVALRQLTGERRYSDVQHYWTGTAGAFMRGADYLPALELIDRTKWRKQLVRWAEEADLSRPSNDGLGRAARERYMKWEVTGDESAAYEALEACVRKMRLMFEAHTWAEPINDRIWLPDHPLILMTQGEMPDERNQLWPRHYVSYAGFSDFAAWVRDKSNTHLRIWLYSFSDTPEDGLVRVWRTPLGQYQVHFGEDLDGDERPDEPATRELTLHRSASIPVRLPPRRLYALESRLLEESNEDFWERPDLAVSPDDVSWTDDGRLKVVVHNIGNSRAQRVVVHLTDGSGKRLAEATIPRIEAPLDLEPRTGSVTFDSVRRSRPVTIVLDPTDVVAELNEGNNRVAQSP